MLIFLPVAYLVARGVLERGMGAYALGRSAWSKSRLGVCFFVGAVAKLLALGIASQLATISVEPQTGGEPRFGPIAVAIGGAVLSTFFPSIAEDIVTRGVVFTGRAWRPAQFVVFSAAVYVLNHIYVIAEGPLTWVRLFSYGLAYGAIVARTGSLWNAVGLHWGWNAAGAGLDVAMPIEISPPYAEPLISSCMHLALLAGIMLLPRQAQSSS
jgi:membrane protease YdiL (CAAX protease family)